MCVRDPIKHQQTFVATLNKEQNSKAVHKMATKSAICHARQGTKRTLNCVERKKNRFSKFETKFTKLTENDKVRYIAYQRSRYVGRLGLGR